MGKHYHIECFGALRVRSEDGVVDRFRTYKTGALLAFLSLHPGPQRREELCTLLWPEAEESAGRNSLSAALSALRREFGEALLVADRNTVGLNPDLYSTDVAAFDAALQSNNLAEAVTLYRGHLLPGFYEDSFLALGREYEEKARSAWEKYLGGIEAEADWSRVRSEVRRALRFFPDHYDWHLKLMRAHQALGEYEGALHVFEELSALTQRNGDELTEAALQLAQSARQQRGSSETGAPAVVIPESEATTPARDAEEVAPVLTGHLPQLWTRFFGREEEIAKLREWLCSGERLITLTGAGGSGKTRLAVETLHVMEGDWDRCYFVPLASLWDAGLLFSAVRDALGIVASPDVPPLEQLGHALRGQKCVLLFDNMEQLGEQGAARLQELRAVLPSAIFLVTSRVVMRLPGEREFPVTPLPTPPQNMTGSGVGLFASAALFCDRANLTLGPENVEAISALCRRLDGIPLALELAAARAGVLSPSQILQLLDKRADFLQSREVGIPQRQRTLRAAIEWSTDLLEPRLRHFYARLSVFRDGWTLQASEQVCAPGICEEWEVVEFLEQLRASSLISINQGPLGTRFRLLEMLREWGESQLEREESRGLEARHLTFYTDLAESALDPIAIAIRGAELEAENANFRAAMSRALERHDTTATEELARLVSALSSFWEGRSLNAEGREWAERALRKPGAMAPATRARLLCCAGAMLWYCGGFPRAQAVLEEGLTLYRSLGDERGEALALDFLGRVFVVTGRCDDTRIYGEMAMEIARRTGDIARLLSSFVTAGWGCHNTKRPAQAIQYFDECIAMCRTLGERRLATTCEATKAFSLLLDGRREECLAQCEHVLATTQPGDGAWAVAFARGIVGIMDVATGNLRRARILLPEVTRQFHGISTRWEVASLLVESGNLSIELEDYQRAALLYGAAQELRERVSYDLLPCLTGRYNQYLPRLEAALRPEEKEALWRRGRSLSLEAAVDIVGELQYVRKRLSPPLRMVDSLVKSEVMNDARAQILANENNLLEAMKTSNVELLDQLLHDDLLFNGPTGETATKAMDLANYRSGNIHLHSLESSDLRMSFIGDDAVVAVTVEIKGNYLGQEIDGQFRYLRVWKRVGDGWQVIGGSVHPLITG